MKVFTLLTLAGLATVSTAEQNLDYDSIIDKAGLSAVWKFFKRATGGSAGSNPVPRKMFPFVATINVDLPKADAQALYATNTLETDANTLTNLFQSYDTYSKAYCAGAVVGQNWIVTSASCMNTIIENGWINNVTIYANRKNLRPTKNENWVDFRIENGASDVYLHPFFNSVTFENDIALIKVQPFSYRGQRIKKLHLKRYKFPRIGTEQQTDALPTGSLVSGGWGVTDAEAASEQFTKYGEYFFLVRTAPSYRFIYQTVETDCAAITGLVINSTTNVCTKGVNDTVLGGPATLCKYDMGAPLFSQGEWYSNRASFNSKLLGVASQYIGAVGATTPCQPVAGANSQIVVYTLIGGHCGWIRQVTNSAIRCQGEFDN